MNPCDCFRPPEFRVNTDTDVKGSCNCCRNNRCESQCNLCCFPFFRRRREGDEKIQRVYDDVVKIKEEIHEGAKSETDGKAIEGEATRGKKKLKRVKVYRVHKKEKAEGI